ncbi:serine/threonine-protein kinase grp-like [Oratosquilla oratoria]|uniref:serine/threonine-protein kinase grp-like n=1 Tax=Oratosquilla oratoria TaxID=337810 RepID=UPI003F75A611
MEPSGISRGFDKDFPRRVKDFVSVCTVMELMVLLGFFNDRIGQLLQDKDKKEDKRQTDTSILRSLTIIVIVLDEIKRSAMPSNKRKFCDLKEETLQATKKLRKTIDFESKMMWKKVRFLGKGGFASVTLVKDATSGFVCAKKTIGIYRLERQLEEIEIHRKLHHDNVVSFLGEDRDSENLYVFLEYVNGDIKPENLFLTKDDDLKIGDFGIAGEFVKGEYLTKICGTSAYIAPEVFTGRYLGEPNDVWACGIVLFKLVTGQNPWKISITNKDINFGVWSYSTEEMRLQKPWKFISRKIFRLIKSILVANPEQRATLGDIEQNEWLLG